MNAKSLFLAPVACLLLFQFAYLVFLAPDVSNPCKEPPDYVFLIRLLSAIFCIFALIVWVLIVFIRYALELYSRHSAKK